MDKIAVNTGNQWEITTTSDNFAGKRILRADLMQAIINQNVSSNKNNQRDLELLYDSLLKQEREDGHYISDFKVSRRDWHALRLSMGAI